MNFIFLNYKLGPLNTYTHILIIMIANTVEATKTINDTEVQGLDVDFDLSGSFKTFQIKYISPNGTVFYDMFELTVTKFPFVFECEFISSLLENDTTLFETSNKAVIEVRLHAEGYTIEMLHYCTDFIQKYIVACEANGGEYKRLERNVMNYLVAEWLRNCPKEEAELFKSFGTDVRNVDAKTLYPVYQKQLVPLIEIVHYLAMNNLMHKVAAFIAIGIKEKPLNEQRLLLNGKE